VALEEAKKDALIDLVRLLKEEITAQVMVQVRADIDATEPVGGLMKVSRAAAWLECHPDHVYRLIHAGDLIGYPFPDDNSHIHVEVDSLRDLLRRRRDQAKRKMKTF
jgi:hypothetical protein